LECLSVFVFRFSFFGWFFMTAYNKDLHHRVAAVCFRRTPAGPEFLLVRTWDGDWTFPKGMVDSGMTETQAAEAEAWEEAGVRGAIDAQPFTTYSHATKKSAAAEVRVTAYLLEVLKSEPPSESHRKPQWFAPDAAKRALAEGRGNARTQQLERVIDLAVQKITAE
jgi:8-oxo-dGTP pyrophosphatase MutT (NUDIX family)